MNVRAFKKLCLELLDEGRLRFGMMMGIVSKVDGESYEIFSASSDTGIPEIGDLYKLDAVYCREVLLKGKTVAITEIKGVQGMHLHPLYDSIPCEAYISSPIFYGGRIWGTLNFTSLEKRNTPFSAEDVSFNEVQAARISRVIPAGT